MNCCDLVAPAGTAEPPDGARWSACGPFRSLITRSSVSRLAKSIKFCHSDRAMAELAAVLAALAGKGGTPTKYSTSPRPLSPSAGRPGWFVPPHLLRLPPVRTSAFAAHDCSREAASNPTDFQTVYRYGLSLQVREQPADWVCSLFGCQLLAQTARRRPLTADRLPSTAGTGQQAAAARRPAVAAAPGGRGVHGGLPPAGGAPCSSPL